MFAPVVTPESSRLMIVALGLQWRWMEKVCRQDELSGIFSSGGHTFHGVTLLTVTDILEDKFIIILASF